MLVTANLNSGGAQRSLINLASAMNGRLDLIVSVAGLSTSNVFQRELESAGVRVIAATHSTLSFNNAEAILAQAAVLNVTCICFWNLDPKVKLLVTKSLAYSSIHLIDVSPGGYCLDSLDDTAEFGELIAFTPKDYYARLNCLVHKYYAPSPLGLRFEPLIIPNGVPLAQRRKVCYDLDASPQVVVNGRITPTKYILEIIAAMRLVRRHFRQAELHLLGGSEELQDEYRAAVDALINEDGGLTVIHGHRADTPERLWQYDLQVTIGANQGCPNATLEALIAGLPVIANRDGGTEEQIIHRETGLLIESRSPEEISRAIFLLLSDRDLARRLAQNGQSHAERTFSMMRMTSSYEHLFMEHGVRAAKETNGDDDQFWTGLKKGEYLEKGDIYEYHV
jgi:glycosyltransferase involved in cell wall biosynthesis